MMNRLTLAAAAALALAGCADGQGLGDLPVYVGDNLIYDPGARQAAGAVTASSGGASECQRLTARVADTGLNDFERQAAANYAASLGC